MLSVHYDGLLYVAKVSFDDRLKCREAGFTWCAITKRWITGSAQAAYRLIEFADPTTKQKIESDLHIETLTHPRVCWPDGRDPFNHQLEAAHFALSRARSYIAADAGLGKTIIAALCMNAVPGKTLIICPAFLKHNWQKELKAWLTYPAKIQLIQTQKDELIPDAHVYILPDSLLATHTLREKFMSFHLDWLFIDEAHRYGNPKAKRTQSLLGAKRVKVSSKVVSWKGFHKLARRTVNLSGTPMRSRPVELFAIANAHAPHAIEGLDWFRYVHLFCNAFMGEWGLDVGGSSNEERLHKALTKHWMLRIKKEDCLDLPDRNVNYLYLSDSKRPKDLAKAEAKLLTEVKVTDLIKQLADTDLGFADKYEARQNSGVIGFMSELRQKNGVAKIDPVAQIVPELLDSEGALIVFCWHDEVIKGLTSRLEKYKPFVITGSTPNKKRFEIQEEFQSSKDRNLVIANIQAAGVGFTLTKASTVLIVEPSYVPSENDQAIDRVHRIGQEWDVNVYYAVWDQSIDHLILNAHHNKTNVAKKVIG